MGDDGLRLSKRKSGKRKKLRMEIARHYEDAFQALMNGVKPPPVAVDLPPGVELKGSNVQPRRRPSRSEREVEARLEHHSRELLDAAADYFRAQNTVKMCVRCRDHQSSVAAQTARLHHVLEKILDEAAPRVRPALV